MPLDVEVTRQDLSSFDELLKWTEEETTFLERSMQREIRELEIDFPDYEDPTRYFIDVQYPKLKALRISGARPFEFASPLLAPQLTELHLFNGTLPWDSLTDLRSLSLGGNCRLALAQLFQVLFTLPLLERLELDSVLQVPSNDIPEEDIPFDPLHMPRLTEVLLTDITCKMVVGLLDHLNAPVCSSASITTKVAGRFNLSALCQQAGRLCRSLGSSAQGTKPRLMMCFDSLVVQMGGKVVLSLTKDGWDVEEGELGFSQKSQLIRLFLEECEGPRFKDPISTASLRYNSRHSGFEGTKIIGDFWPETSSLSVEANTGIGPVDVVRALAETRDTGDGSSKWCLPKLTEIGFTMERYPKVFDDLVDIAIERTQAASVSPSTISPITKLTVFSGVVWRSSLTKLDKVGIQYHLDRVNVL